MKLRACYNTKNDEHERNYKKYEKPTNHFRTKLIVAGISLNM